MSPPLDIAPDRPPPTNPAKSAVPEFPSASANAGNAAGNAHGITAATATAASACGLVTRFTTALKMLLNMLPKLKYPLGSV
jgi:hypothetical protein